MSYISILYSGALFKNNIKFIGTEILFPQTSKNEILCLFITTVVAAQVLGTIIARF